MRRAMKGTNFFLSTTIILFSLCFLVNCQNKSIPSRNLQQTNAATSIIALQSADDVIVVDCLLPGQVRKLGRMTYLSARRPVKTTQLDCEIRGGEYVAFDRSDLSTALSVWLPMAKKGDEVAQTYVGEIYQRGMGTPPDFALASEWFQKAARQGFTRAQISLGNLYEHGLGVPKDPAKALALYRQASGLKDVLNMDAGTLSPEERQELERLRDETRRQKQQTEKLRHKLDQTLQELEKNRREFNEQAGKITSEWQVLQVAKTELEQRKESSQTDSSELQILATKLKQREIELEKRQQDIAHLQKKIAGKETEIDNFRQDTDRFQKRLADLPPPSIEIYDPKPVGTRGAIPLLAMVRPGLLKRQIIGRVWAPVGLSDLRINTKTESWDSSGRFKTWVPLSRHENTDIHIVAVDANGKESQISFQLKAGSASSSSTAEKIRASFDFGKFYALVIGNNDYHNLPKLKTAANDARAVAALLEKQYGFQVTLKENQNRKQIFLSIEEFHRNLTEKDNFLLYYAGHGELDTKNNRGYWMSIDATKDSTVEWIRTDQITDKLNLMSPLRTLVIADTCYSGIMTRSALTLLESGTSIEKRYELIKKLAQKKARVVLSSGGLKPVLDSGIGNHSVYAGSLIKILETNRDILRARELHDEVTKEVAYISERLGLEQIPQYGGLIRSGHEMGDFIFVSQ